MSPHLDSSKVEDWHDCTVPILTAYKLECTAEAKEVTVARAIELKHKPDLISALAHETRWGPCFLICFRLRMIIMSGLYV